MCTVINQTLYHRHEDRDASIFERRRFMMKVKRVSIIGISGSGKSILSRDLGRRMGLPVFHMDTWFWTRKWQEVPEIEYLAKHRALIEQDQWIVEGYVDTAMAHRLERSDLIIFLDYPGWFCALRVIKRWVLHRNKSRPELPEESKEELRYAFLKKVWQREERGAIMEALKVASPSKVLRFRSPRQLGAYLSR